MADHDRPIIIKKVKKGGHAHHGGAWKIAYADFVTAMMAFFLLLWLISMTTDEQKKGLADYFAPASLSETVSGAGGVLAGRAMDDSGAKEEVSQPPKPTPDLSDLQDGTELSAQDAISLGQEGSGDGDAMRASQTDLGSTMQQEFHAAAASIEQAWQAMPNITEVADNLIVQETEDGLEILIVDQEGRPMFPEGSKYPYEITRQAIAAIAPILERLPSQISISGHTAAGGIFVNERYGPWELSSDRANVVRTILGEFGLSEDHISSVIGRASTEPFFPNDPHLSANERIKITVLTAAPPVPPDLIP